MLKHTGIVRRMDDLGRIVFPKELRKQMGLKENDPARTRLRSSLKLSCLFCGIAVWLLSFLWTKHSGKSARAALLKLNAGSWQAPCAKPSTSRASMRITRSSTWTAAGLCMLLPGLLPVMVRLPGILCWAKLPKTLPACPGCRRNPAIWPPWRSRYSRKRGGCSDSFRPHNRKRPHWRWRRNPNPLR